LLSLKKYVEIVCTTERMNLITISTLFTFVQLNSIPNGIYYLAYIYATVI